MVLYTIPVQTSGLPIEAIGRQGVDDNHLEQLVNDFGVDLMIYANTLSNNLPPGYTPQGIYWGTTDALNAQMYERKDPGAYIAEFSTPPRDQQPFGPNCPREFSHYFGREGIYVKLELPYSQTPRCHH